MGDENCIGMCREFDFGDYLDVVRSGMVENITNVSDIQNFQQDANYTVDIASGVRCGFSWMNLNGVLGNKTLRQAILMGIDNDTICSSKTIGGLYTAGFSVLPSTLSLS